MDFMIIYENLGIYWDGLLTTIQLVGLSLLIGLMIAIPLAILHSVKNPIVNMPVRFYVYFFRGTPLLVQIFIIYYGFGQFEWIKSSSLWVLFENAYFCALFTLILNTGAYTTEIIRGAIETTPFGEIEAATSMGMTRLLALRRIILPSALRRAFPAYSNEIIFMLHGSSIVSVITIVDLTGAARIINSRYYSPYEAFITAGLFYLALTLSIVFICKKVEKKIYAHLVRTS